MPLDTLRDTLDASIRLQHELLQPLDVILAHAHLLQQLVQDVAGLSEQEQTGLLANLASIEQQVEVLGARINTVQSASYFDEE